MLGLHESQEKGSSVAYEFAGAAVQCALLSLSHSRVFGLSLFHALSFALMDNSRGVQSMSSHPTLWYLTRNMYASSGILPID